MCVYAKLLRLKSIEILRAVTEIAKEATMAQEDIKGFLYAWLGKQKVTPDYNIRPTGWYYTLYLGQGPRVFFGVCRAN